MIFKLNFKWNLFTNNLMKFWVLWRGSHIGSWGSRHFASAERNNFRGVSTRNCGELLSKVFKISGHTKEWWGVLVSWRFPWATPRTELGIFHLVACQKIQQPSTVCCLLESRYTASQNMFPTVGAKHRNPQSRLTASYKKLL